jgi:hypothetical protein
VPLDVFLHCFEHILSALHAKSGFDHLLVLLTQGLVSLFLQFSQFFSKVFADQLSLFFNKNVAVIVLIELYFYSLKLPRYKGPMFVISALFVRKLGV